MAALGSGHDPGRGRRARWSSAVGADAQASVSGGDRGRGRPSTCPPSAWAAALTAARDDLGCDFFDWLSAVDELDEGYAVVAHLWSTAQRHGVLMRTRVPRDGAGARLGRRRLPGRRLARAGDARDVRHRLPRPPRPRPLLLPPEFEGHPLRKEFVLASRVAKPWPGAKEPGESHAEGRPSGSRCARPACPRPASGARGRRG